MTRSHPYSSLVLTAFAFFCLAHSPVSAQTENNKRELSVCEPALVAKLAHRSADVRDGIFGARMYDSYLNAMNGPKYLVPEVEVFIKEALSDPGSMMRRLSPMRAKATPIEAAFFVRLFEPSIDRSEQGIPSHAEQVLRPLHDAIISSDSWSEAQHIVNQSLRNMKTNISGAKNLGYLKGLFDVSSEDILAKLLSSGARDFPQLTTMMAMSVGTLTTRGRNPKPLFDTTRVLGSDGFDAPPALEGTPGLHGTLAEGALRSLPENIGPENLERYWAMVVKSSEEVLLAFEEALKEALLTGPFKAYTQDGLSLALPIFSPLYQAMAELANTNGSFKRTFTKIQADLFNEVGESSP